MVVLVWGCEARQPSFLQLGESSSRELPVTMEVAGSPDHTSLSSTAALPSSAVLLDRTAGLRPCPSAANEAQLCATFVAFDR
jgi:hypothetical protein